MSRRAALPALALAVAGVLGPAACSSGGSDAPGPRLTVEGAYMPQPVTTDTAGGFLVVRNGGDTGDRLTSVRSEISDDVRIHRSSGGRMREVSSLSVPADGELRLGRGGDHLMFRDLDRRPARGETVSVELRFEKSGPITVDLPVEATNHVPERHGSGQHGSGHSHDAGE